MVHRDPETGKFVSDDGFDDYEIVTFEAGAGVQAADLSGGTGFDGGDIVQFQSESAVVDYDEIVDRNEELHLLAASHHLVVYVNSTETADGTVIGTAAITADPATGGVRSQTTGTQDQYDEDNLNVVGGFAFDDSIDIVGRPLDAVAHAPFTDGASGLGGGGAAGHDSYDSDAFPSEFGRFHPRDELFLTGEFTAWNINDAGIHAEVKGQHIYGVVSD